MLRTPAGIVDPAESDGGVGPVKREWLVRGTAFKGTPVGQCRAVQRTFGAMILTLAPQLLRPIVVPSSPLTRRG